MRTFTIEERLKLYRIALEHWAFPQSATTLATMSMDEGFCRYFSGVHGIKVWLDQDFLEVFPELYEQRVLMNGYDIFHYPKMGKDEEGRLFRVQALKGAILLCQNTIKQSALTKNDSK